MASGVAPYNSSLYRSQRPLSSTQHHHPVFRLRRANHSSPRGNYRDHHLLKIHAPTLFAPFSHAAPLALHGNQNESSP
jgi:hypothetical protein